MEKRYTGTAKFIFEEYFLKVCSALTKKNKIKIFKRNRKPIEASKTLTASRPRKIVSFEAYRNI
jgi:hypothetical protein